MATPESKVKVKIHSALGSAGAYAVNYIGGQYATAGTPDILACLHGRFIGIEAKANGNKPTALQIHALKRIEAAGGVAWVIDDKNVHLLPVWLSNIRCGIEQPSNYMDYT